MLALILMFSLLWRICRTSLRTFTGCNTKTMQRLRCNSKHFVESLESINQNRKRRISSVSFKKCWLSWAGVARIVPILKPARIEVELPVPYMSFVICLSTRTTINSNGCNIESALMSFSFFTIFTIAEIFLRSLQISTSPNTISFLPRKVQELCKEKCS